MSRVAHDPPTRKPSSGFTSAAARLLLRHSRREATNGDSIEFFAALRKCLPDPHVSGQTPAAPTRAKARRGGCSGSADEVLSLSSGIGKHDYDWLLTPPGTPLRSPATSTSGHQVSSAVPSRLAKAGSPTTGKSNSRLGPEKKDCPTTSSRLSNCSSATSINLVPSGRLLRVQTSSASSISTTSNASVSSTPPVWSAGSSKNPRIPGTAKSAAAATAQQRRRHDEARQATGHAAVQSRASSKSKPAGAPAPTCSQAHPATGISSPRSTASTSRRPSLARYVNAVVARSRLALASQSSGAGSKSQPRDAHPTRSPSGVASSSSSNGIKPRLVPATAKEDGAAVSSTTTRQRWQQSLAPAIAAARNVRRERMLHNGSPRNSAGGPAHQKPTLLHGRSRSVVSKSRLGRMAATSSSKSGSIASGGHKSGSGCHLAAATAMATAAGQDAFPSMRYEYDAMLLREDPKNLTWLRSCEEGDDSSVGGLDLVDGSPEPFDVVR